MRLLLAATALLITTTAFALPTFTPQLVLKNQQGETSVNYVQYPGTTFIGGKIVFARERWFQRLLHNETSLAIQRRLYWLGATMVVLPAKVT